MKPAPIDMEKIMADLEKSDLNTSTVRSSVGVFWFSLLAGLVYKLTGVTLSVDDLVFFAPVVAVVFGVFYRIGRVVERKWPTLGYVLFGSKKTPWY